MLAAAMVGNRQSGPSERGCQRSGFANKAKATATGTIEMKKARRVRLRVLRSLRVCVCASARPVCCLWVCTLYTRRQPALFMCIPQHPSALNSASPLPRAEN